MTSALQGVVPDPAAAVAGLVADLQAIVPALQALVASLNGAALGLVGNVLALVSGLVGALLNALGGGSPLGQITQSIQGIVAGLSANLHTAINGLLSIALTIPEGLPFDNVTNIVGATIRGVQKCLNDELNALQVSVGVANSAIHNSGALQAAQSVGGGGLLGLGGLLNVSRVTIKLNVIPDLIIPILIEISISPSP